MIQRKWIFSKRVLLTGFVFLLGGCATGPKPVVSGRVGILDDERKVTEVRAPEIQKVTEHWSWPLKISVHVTSAFGLRGERLHEGVDLRAPVKTPVFAAHSGRVLYAGSKIHGYGRMVLIRDTHSGLVTLYAHHSKNLVRVGQTVRQGQKIALSGSSGKSTGPHLHFEIREGVHPVDPLLVMSKRPMVLASRK